MPLQFDLNRSLKKAKNGDESSAIERKQDDAAIKSQNRHYEGKGLKENNPLKYNYLCKAER